MNVVSFKKQSSLAFEKYSHVIDDFNLKDFIDDNEWKEILKEEFDKKYFLELNTTLKSKYEKNLVRPKKELIFNALNSTKINQASILFIKIFNFLLS